MAYQDLLLEKDNNVGIVTLNRPEKLNAISRELHQEMMQVCRELKDDDEIRVVIWIGAGRGFCSGVDLTASRDRPEVSGRQERLDEFGWVGRQAMMVSRELNKPTIAAVNGVAVDAGMSLACDLRESPTDRRIQLGPPVPGGGSFEASTSPHMPR